MRRPCPASFGGTVTRCAKSPPRGCPPQTERHTQGGDEGSQAARWWCARGEVRHGPYGEQGFDARDRSWYDIRGEYRHGERHGNLDHVGFYPVEHSGAPRVFRREVYDRGRLVRSNESRVQRVLDAEHPVVRQRFIVRASGLSATSRWEDEPDAVGTLDADVDARWAEGPADATPSVLRVTLSTPWSESPVHADGLLYGQDLEYERIPRTDSALPFGYLPRVAATWRRCDPAGCEIPVEVTLTWLVPGPGRVQIDLVMRAVPQTWPEVAIIDVRADEP